MFTKKQLNISTIILLVFAGVLLFYDKMFSMVDWKIRQGYNVKYTEAKNIENKSFFNSLGHWIGTEKESANNPEWIGYVLGVLFIIVFTLTVMDFLNYKKIKKQFLLITASTLVIFDILALARVAAFNYAPDSLQAGYVENKWGKYFNANFVVYLQIIILVIMLALVAYRCFGDLRAEPEATSQLGNLEEITKLKELLDGGIITQEEFEKKKEQLLGL